MAEVRLGVPGLLAVDHAIKHFAFARQTPASPSLVPRLRAGPGKVGAARWPRGPGGKCGTGGRGPPRTHARPAEGRVFAGGGGRPGNPGRRRGRTGLYPRCGPGGPAQSWGPLVASGAPVGQELSVVSCVAGSRTAPPGASFTSHCGAFVLGKLSGPRSERKDGSGYWGPAHREEELEEQPEKCAGITQITLTGSRLTDITEFEVKRPPAWTEDCGPSSKTSLGTSSHHHLAKMRQLKGKPKKETSKDKKERKQAMQEARQQITTVVLPTLAVVVLLIVVFVYVATRPTVTE
ncbi:single-pass membrane protein with coiled-coil domains 4 [Cricetulus griseus]